MNEPAAAAMRLAIGKEASTLAFVVEGSGAVESSFHWALGSRQLGRPAPWGDRPTAWMLEQAIEAIEDAVMPAARVWRGTGELVLSPAAFQRLAPPAASGAPPPRLTTDEVELRFNDVAAVAQGRPGGPPWDGGSIATLLIVREVLHHFGLQGVVAGD